MSSSSMQRWFGMFLGLLLIVLVVPRLFTVDAGPPLPAPSAAAPAPPATPARAPSVQPTAEKRAPAARPQPVEPPEPPAPPTESDDLDRVATATAVRGVFKRYSGQLQYCYESVLATIPDADGSADVVLHIAGGRAVDVQVDDFTTADQTFTDCVADKVAGWSFDGVPDGSVTWPVRFKSLSAE